MAGVRFAPKISVHVGRDAFRFTQGSASLSLATVLWVEPISAGLRIVSVGEAPVGASGVVRVGLFDGEACSVLPLEQGRMWALEAFLREAFYRLARTRIRMRPAVSITGVDTLDPCLGGYQAAILIHAFIAAGAQQVTFSVASSGV